MTQIPSVEVMTEDVHAGSSTQLQGAEKGVEARSPSRLAWERLRRDKVAMGSAVVVVLLVLVAVFAPVIAAITGHGVNQQYHDIGLDAAGTPRTPNGTFWLGTDDVGRDLLVRIVYGARISLVVGVVATAIALLIGIVIGLVAGFYGGVIDTILSRFIDIVLSFPFLLTAIAIVSVTHASMWVSVFIIAFFSWSTIARVVRGQVLSAKEREYVEAAKSLGASDRRIMFVDILPNLVAPIIVYATLSVPAAIVFEATLSFLGLSVVPPTATWGGILNESEQWYQFKPTFFLFPSIALLITTLAFNLFGDGLRDALDPRAERTMAK